MRERNITTDEIAIEISFVFFMSLDTIDVQNKCLSVMCVCMCVCVCVCNLRGVLSPYAGSVLTDTTDGQLNTSFHFGSVLLEERNMDLEVKSMSVDTGQHS